MGNAYCPTPAPKPIRLRSLRAKHQAAREAIGTCEGALVRFPDDAVYTRSLRHWQRIEAHLSTEIAARTGRLAHRLDG